MVHRMTTMMTGVFLLIGVLVGVAAAAEDVDVPSLAEVYADDFMIGFASDTVPMEAAAVLSHHFNVVTHENALKWESVHPQPDVYNFGRAERMLEWAEARDMKVIGHTLVWHSQTPGWVFQGEGGQRLTREQGLARMKEHIDAVAGHFCGRIHGWDVVNEALEEDGRLRNSPWLAVVGDDYIEWAFRYAHEACPDAELYYNDYNLTTPAKRQGAVRIVRQLQEAGVPIHAVGEQAHYDVYGPSIEQVQATIEAFANLGVKVMITELDMSVYAWTERDNKYAAGLPADMAQLQADRYRALFELFLEYRDDLERVTFWGTTDRYTWKNFFPVPNRPDHPLLFDRQANYKPAFWAVLEAGQQ